MGKPKQPFVSEPEEQEFGMVWYGMVRYGMAWYGMVWYGMVWYGMAWYRTVRHGMGVLNKA